MIKSEICVIKRIFGRIYTDLYLQIIIQFHIHSENKTNGDPILGINVTENNGLRPGGETAKRGKGFINNMELNKSQEEYLRQLKTTVIKLIHLLLSVGIFYIFWLLFRFGHLSPTKDAGFRYNYLTTIGYGVILFFFNRTYNSYLLGYSRIRDLVFSELISQLFSVASLYFLVSIGWNQWNSPVWFLPMLAVQLVLDIVWAYLANGYFFKLYPPKKTILIYRNKMDKKRFGSIRGKPSERLYSITKELMYDGRFTDLRDQLKGYDAIFVAGVNSQCRNGILKYCKEESIPGFFLPHVGDVIMQESRHIQSFDSPVLYVSRTVLKPEYRIIKRTFDLIVSGLGIIVLSPILASTALAIRLYDHGPAIYKQVRLTRDGREFKIWKFRSMRVDAEKDGIARLSTGDNDDRITPIGHFVRKCRLDELHQLFNIFLGDMSFVGPRPERPEIAEQYYEKIPDFKLRLQAKAGLTGYAQVYGKYNTDPYEKLEFDLLYINNMSVLTDLRLIFATFSILFSKESTEGVKEGTVTAIEAGDID